MNAPVCIAGAHCSGTSMVALLLQRSGLFIGKPSSPTSALADFPRMENSYFQGMNLRILETMNLVWEKDPPTTHDFSLPKWRALKTEALVRAERYQKQSPGLWGWKDPFNCFTLLFWAHVFPDLKTVAVVRNPTEVASSFFDLQDAMSGGRGVTLEESTGLWYQFNGHLHANLQTVPHIVTLHASYFVDPEQELARVSPFLGLHPGPGSHWAVNSRLRHYHATDPTGFPGLTPPMWALYESLKTAAGSP